MMCGKSPHCQQSVTLRGKAGARIGNLQIAMLLEELNTWKPAVIGK